MRGLIVAKIQQLRIGASKGKLLEPEVFAQVRSGNIEGIQRLVPSPFLKYSYEIIV